MTSKSIRLSPSQQEAVSAPWMNQMYMVLSTAGSGKTAVLSLRAVRIAKDLLDRNAHNKRLLCVCFNQAMADEMHHRISQLVHDQHLSADVAVTRTSYSVSRGVTIEVRTFHGLGRYLLNAAAQPNRNRVAVPSGYLNVLPGLQLRKLFFEALKYAGCLNPQETEKSAKHKIFNMLSHFEDYKGKHFDKICEKHLLEGSAYQDDAYILKEFKSEFQVYQSLLYDRGVIDYGDMGMKSVRLLLTSSKAQDFLKYRYASVLVDEFQDVSASQLIMTKVAVSVSNSLTLVGDDDQQIYSWRTSNNWFCHTVAKHVFPSLKTVMLPENRRCPGSVVRAAYAVISKNPGRAPKEIKAVRSNGVPVQVVGCSSLDIEKQFVLKSVQRLLTRAKQYGERTLILFRINDLLQQFQTIFKDAGIHTTRDIRPKKDVVAIGSFTLGTLAIITLIAPEVDVDTFVWAATTLSPSLEERYVHDVLNKRERIDNDIENQSSSRRGSGGDSDRKHRRKRNSTGRAVSVYLERLRSHMSDQTTEIGDEGEDGIMALYEVVKTTDELLIGVRRSDSVQDVVKHASNVLTVSNDIGSQGSVAENDVFDNSNSKSKKEYAGHKVLLSAAKKVDSKSKLRERRERDRTPQRRARIQKVEKVKATSQGQDDDDDLDDFAELFSNDVKHKKKKRRTSLGIKGEDDRIADNEKDEYERVVTTLGDDINEFCNIVRRSLGDYSSGVLNDVSRTNNSSYVDADSCPVFSTVHAAKGSTFHHVFLCGVSRYNFPNGQVVCGIGNNGTMGTVGEMDPNGMHCQEERRVFFVAQTRAVTQFICTYSGEGKMGPSPKAHEGMFISELLSGLVGNETKDVDESFVADEAGMKTVSDRLIEHLE